MQVETFEQTECSSIGEEKPHDEKALKLIDDLGLRGQKELTAHDGITRIPYRSMNAIEERVYEILFPQRTEVEEYSASMIPVRVLQVLAHAKALDCYRRIEVWSEESQPTDPLLVGVRVNPRESWRSDRHILARWGDALEPFDVLYNKALKLAGRRMSSEALIARATAEGVIGQSEAAAVRYLETGARPSYLS